MILNNHEDLINSNIYFSDFFTHRRDSLKMPYLGGVLCHEVTKDVNLQGLLFLTM